MTNTVFYSWQSDSPANTNRNFIEGVLKRVITEIGQEEGDVEVAARPLQLDKDTKGVAGSPSIVDAILRKIENCGVFVPDMTFVGETPVGRPLQNPNVLIEYGWALAHVGDARIVAVMNTAYGEPDKESMPFDLVHKRWPIRYCLEEGADAAERKRVKDVLVRDLKGAILAAFSEVPALPRPEGPQLKPKSRKTSFLDDGDLIGKLKWFQDESKVRDMRWDDGPQLSLRIVPEMPVEHLKRVKLSEVVHQQRPTFIAPQFRSHWDIPNEYGVAVIEADGQVDQSSTRIVTQVTTWGEIWGIDAKTLSNSPDHLLFPEFIFAQRLKNYLAYLREHFSYNGLVSVEAGYSGIAGRTCFLPGLAAGFQYQSYTQTTGTMAVDEFVTVIPSVSVNIEDTSSLDVSAQALLLPEFPSKVERAHCLDAYMKLLPFFEEFWDNLGVPRPAFLPRVEN